MTDQSIPQFEDTPRKRAIAKLNDEIQARREDVQRDYQRALEDIAYFRQAEMKRIDVLYPEAACDE